MRNRLLRALPIPFKRGMKLHPTGEITIAPVKPTPAQPATPSLILNRLNLDVTGGLTKAGVLHLLGGGIAFKLMQRQPTQMLVNPQYWAEVYPLLDDDYHLHKHFYGMTVKITPTDENYKVRFV